MIGHLAYAEGSPCPTLVLDARVLPRETDALLEVLTEVRQWLATAGGAHVLKLALVEPSEHPMYDIDYRFIQALPEGPDKFDLRGSCGHSILSTIMACAESGMLPRLSLGARISVNVINNGDHVVAEIDEAHRSVGIFSVHFLHNPPKPVSELLLTGKPITTLEVDGDPVDVSLVSAGNPYVFVSAASLGVTTKEELFADSPELFDRLVRIRVAAAKMLGWSPEGAFPKVAITMPDGPGNIAVRAVSVPSWHPTLALTGSACLGAATRIEGTIPWLAAQQEPGKHRIVDIETAGGHTAATAGITTRDDLVSELNWITVGRKKVTLYGSFVVPPLARFQLKEASECLPLSI